MNRTAHLIAALTAGCLAAFVVSIVGFWLLRTTWPAYAAAEPHKAYTFVMLVSRLALGVLCAAIAGRVAATIAPDQRLAPWLMGAIILAASIPQHLYPGYVWNDYPAWYHVTYLSYLVPVAGVAGSPRR